MTTYTQTTVGTNTESLEEISKRINGHRELRDHYALVLRTTEWDPEDADDEEMKEEMENLHQSMEYIIHKAQIEEYALRNNLRGDDIVDSGDRVFSDATHDMLFKIGRDPLTYAGVFPDV